jgi:hypothetical protein
MKKVYNNGKFIIIPQFDHFVRFMKKYGLHFYLKDRSLLSPMLNSLYGYIEAVMELTREFIYDVDGSVIPDSKIYEELSTCNFYLLFERAGTSINENIMRELVALTKLFVTYLMVTLNNDNFISILEQDVIIRDVDETNIIIEIDMLSSGFND